MPRRPEEIPRLNALLERGTANGLQDLQLLNGDQIRDYEPHAAGIAAIRVPEEGIVDFKAATQAMADEVLSRGGEVRYSCEVLKLQNTGSWRISTTGGDFEADFLINCGGLQCDRLSNMAGNHDATRIVPFRGEYYKLKPSAQHLVRNLIYPVPDPKFPFLGVHFTRLIHGGIEAGPNAVLAFAREGYRHTDFVCATWSRPSRIRASGASFVGTLRCAGTSFTAPSARRSFASPCRGWYPNFNSMI